MASNKISVIIPCYRDVKTLARALDSVYAQTRKPDEVIVVNDCSPETEAIELVLGNYPQVVYILNRSNFGPAISRNIGIERCQSEVISFLDADDELHPQKIEFQAALLKPGVVISCANRSILLGENLSTKAKNNHRRMGRVRSYTKSREIIYRHRLTGASIMAYKKDLDFIGRYDPSLRAAEDYDLFLKILDAGYTIKHINLPLYLYWRNQSSLSNQLDTVMLSEMEMIRRAFTREEIYPPFQGEAATIWGFWILKHILKNYKFQSRSVHVQIDRNLNYLQRCSFARMILSLIRVFLNSSI